MDDKRQTKSPRIDREHSNLRQGQVVDGTLKDRLSLRLLSPSPFCFPLKNLLVNGGMCQCCSAMLFRNGWMILRGLSDTKHSVPNITISSSSSWYQRSCMEKEGGCQGGTSRPHGRDISWREYWSYGLERQSSSVKRIIHKMHTQKLRCRAYPRSLCHTRNTKNVCSLGSERSKSTSTKIYNETG